MDPLRWRLSLETRHDGREEPEGLIDACLQISQLPQGPGVEVAACHLGREELVDLLL